MLDQSKWEPYNKTLNEDSSGSEESWPDLMDIDWQPPTLLPLACTNAKIEATTLILGPLGLEKESIKKARLELSLSV